VISYFGKTTNRVLGEIIDSPKNLHIEVCKKTAPSPLIEKDNCISGFFLFFWTFITLPYLLFYKEIYVLPKSRFELFHIIKFLSLYNLGLYLGGSGIICVYLTNSVPYYGLILGLKRRGVEVIEVQHGLIHKDHLGYFNNFPNDRFLPNIFYVKIPSTSNIIKNSPFADFVKIQNFFSSFLEKAKISIYDFVLIDRYPEREELIELYKTLISLDFRVAYASKYPFKVKNRSISIDMICGRTYELICSSICVVGGRSTAVLESHDLGVKTFLINCETHEFWLKYGVDIPVFNLENYEKI
jgi:hypothetical protein